MQQKHFPQRSAPEKLTLTTTEASSGPLRVLIVDDEKPIREVLVDILQDEGYDVRCASDGDEALLILDEHHSHILVTDLEMPRMRGIELLKQTRSLASPPISILMTGFGTVETAIEAMKLGAFDYILKPFKVEEFIALIRKAANKYRLESENVQLKEYLSLYRISEAMMSTLDLKEVLHLIAELVLTELRADWVAIYFREQKTGFDLQIEKRRDDSGAEVPFPTINFDNLIDAMEKRDYLAYSGKKLSEIIIDPSESRTGSRSPVASLLASPLRAKGTLKGFVIVGSYDPHHTFSDGHGKTLVIFSSRAVLALENARLFKELNQAFTQTIEGLVAALEAKDNYTRGHSERVAHFARLIAEAMNLSPAEADNVTHAALLHDIGKIGIHVEYLNKPGRLTDEENRMFQLHPLLSKNIIQPIQFLQEIVPIVYHHHEHYDGTGYPEGKKGDEIPIGARILAVADSFEVMISDRPYRKALSRREAVEELKQCSGTQFDPRVVNLFLKILGEKPLPPPAA